MKKLAKSKWFWFISIIILIGLVTLNVFCFMKMKDQEEYVEEIAEVVEMDRATLIELEEKIEELNFLGHYENLRTVSNVALFSFAIGQLVEWGNERTNETHEDGRPVYRVFFKDSNGREIESIPASSIEEIISASFGDLEFTHGNYCWGLQEPGAWRFNQNNNTYIPVLDFDNIPSNCTLIYPITYYASEIVSATIDNNEYFIERKNILSIGYSPPLFFWHPSDLSERNGHFAELYDPITNTIRMNRSTYTERAFKAYALEKANIWRYVFRKDNNDNFYLASFEIIRSDSDEQEES